MPDLLTAEQTAEWLQIPTATLYRWRYIGEGPPAARVGRFLRYRRSDLEEWVASRVVPHQKGAPTPGRFGHETRGERPS